MVVDKTSYGIDFLFEIFKGQKTGHKTFHQHGHNDAVGTSFVDIWGKNAKMIYLSSAETMNMVSDDVNDASAGTGARTIKVEGLDNDFNEISETVVMNGTTNVLTTLSYRRVTDITTLTAGTGLENAGQIKATSTSTTEDQSIMEPLTNHSLNGRYTSPVGKAAIFASYEINVAKGKDVVIDIRAGNGEAVTQSVHLNHIFQNTIFSPVPDAIVGEKTDILFRAKSDAASTGVTCAFNIIEIDLGLVNL